MFCLLCPHLRRNPVRFMWYFCFLFLFESFFWVKIFEWSWATKGYKELVFASCFLVWPGPGSGVWAAPWGLPQGLSPDHTCSASQPCGSPNNGGSHEWSHRSFLKEAPTGTPRGPEETWGSSGSSSEQQDVQLVTCGQGIRGSCVLSLPLTTRPTGKPSLLTTQLSTAVFFFF